MTAMLHRRKLLQATAALAVGAGPVTWSTRAGGQSALESAARPRTIPAGEWLAFKTRYVTPEGRVVDTANGGISHSEGQGYAMLLSVAMDDREAFDRLWSWTRRELQVRDDRLFAWKWDPAHKGGQVGDANNATDGDMLIVWALLRASRRWRDRTFRLAGEKVLDDIERMVVVPSAVGPVILPGAKGFDSESRLTVNPSYWVFPAMQEIAATMRRPMWNDLVGSGYALLERARFGEHKLPPDWLDLAPEPQLPKDFPPVYGFNALRIPLYVAWAKGHTAATPRLEPFITFAAGYERLYRMPATIDLANGQPGSSLLSTGGQAIILVARSVALSLPADLPPMRPQEDYYSSVLLLLCKLCLSEISS